MMEHRGTDENGIEEQDIESWKYIKEGNSSFVIGHRKKHIIYRMWKQDLKDVLERNSRKEDCRTKINYIKNHLQPVLGKYASIPKCIPVSSNFVSAVSKAFENQRPVKRCHQVIDPYQTAVLCSPNFCFLDDTNNDENATLTVEIKPKLGYIHTHHHQSHGIEEYECVCLFCMQQTLKRKEGAWDYTSKYCPVNLFSGERDRMRHALECLFKTPQNNLCVFKNGELIFPREGKTLPTQEDQEDITMAIQSWFRGENDCAFLPKAFTKSTCIQDLISLVIQALCSSDNSLAIQDVSSESSPWLPCLEGQNHSQNQRAEAGRCRLPKGCVLDRILAMQCMDSHGIAVIHRVYQRYITHLAQHPEQKVDLSIINACSSPQTSNLNQRLTDEEIASLPIHDCVSLLKGYMMSRTARDCSVLVTLKPADVSTVHTDVLLLKEHQFHFSCQLVDLDSKSPDKIPYYYKLEQLISQTYHAR